MPVFCYPWKWFSGPIKFQMTVTFQGDIKLGKSYCHIWHSTPIKDVLIVQCWLNNLNNFNFKISKDIGQIFTQAFFFQRLKVKKVLVAQLCPTLCDPMDCSPPASSIHRILQRRILGWVAISFFMFLSGQPLFLSGSF